MKSRARHSKINLDEDIDDDDSDDDPSFNENASQLSEDFVDEVEDSDQEESTSQASQPKRTRANPTKRKPRSAPKNSQTKPNPSSKASTMSLFPEANGWMSKKSLNKNPSPTNNSKPSQPSLQQYFHIIKNSNKQNNEPSLSISVNKTNVDVSNNPFMSLLAKPSSKPSSNNNSQTDINNDSEEEVSLVNKRTLKRSHEVANELTNSKSNGNSNSNGNSSTLNNFLDLNDTDVLDLDLDMPAVDVSRKRLKRMTDIPDETKATSSQASPADSSSKSSSVHSTPSPAITKPNNTTKPRTPITIESDSDSPSSKSKTFHLVLSSDSEEDVIVTKPKNTDNNNNKFSQYANTTFHNRTSVFNQWQNAKTNNTSNNNNNKPPPPKESNDLELSDQEIRSMDTQSLRDEVAGVGGGTGIKWGAKTVRAMKQELLKRLSSKIGNSRTDQKQSRSQRLQDRIYSQDNSMQEPEEQPEAEEEEEEEAESSDSDDEDFTIDKLIEACNEFSQRRAKSLSTLKEQITKGQCDNNNKDMYIEPCLLKKQLKHYQVVGINWLFMLHKENLNGILADEMGLGKTIQSIAFLTYLYSIGQKGPHLIVVPASTLMNWNREFSEWTSCLGVYVYHGSQKEREFQRSEIKHRLSEAQSESDKEGSDVEVTDNRALNVIVTTYNIMEQRYDKSFLRKLKFDYLILDEAQSIKNSTSVRYKSLMKMRAKHKLLLTGTPLQNNLQELWSLLNFIMPHMFESSSKEMLKKLLQTTSEAGPVGTEARKNQYINKMKAIIEPFILRRLKADVRGLVLQLIKQVSIELPKKSESVIRLGMTEMQQDIYNAILQQSQSTWKKHKQSLQNPDEVIDLDANSDEENVAPEKSDNEDTTKPKTNGKETKKNGKPALIHSPAKKLGKKKHQSIFSILKNTLMQLRKASLHPLLLRSIYTNEQIKTMASLLKECDIDYEEETLLNIKEDLMCCSDFELHSLCTKNKILKSFALKDEQVFESSSKLLRLKSLLEEHIFKNESRVLVFSQMTKVLDIIECYLEHLGHQCLRLDGSTPVSERQQLIDLFNEEKDIGVFLLSTKAGGLGINLTSADVVIFFDISFNPQVERQAEDRVHRLGQEKAVTVIKLIVQDSIEENILKMANQKKELNDVMLNEGSYIEAKNHSQTKQMLSIFEDLFKQTKDIGRKAKPVHVYSVEDNE